MSISSKQIAKALISSIKSGGNVLNISKKFETFIEKNHLITLVPNIIENLKKEVSNIENKKLAIIKVPYQVTTKSIKSIENLINKDKEDLIKIDIDESLIGGFKASYKGRVYDGSVKNYLKQLNVNLMK